MISYFPEKWFPAVHGNIVTIVFVKYFKRFICFV